MVRTGPSSVSPRRRRLLVFGRIESKQPGSLLRQFVGSQGASIGSARLAPWRGGAKNPAPNSGSQRYKTSGFTPASSTPGTFVERFEAARPSAASNRRTRATTRGIRVQPDDLNRVPGIGLHNQFDGILGMRLLGRLKTYLTREVSWIEPRDQPRRTIGARRASGTHLPIPAASHFRVFGEVTCPDQRTL